MFIELNLPAGEKQRTYCDYFNAGMRTLGRGWSAYLDVLDDGTAVFDGTVSVQVREERVPTTWSYRTTSDGHLDGLTVSAPEKWEDDPDWRDEVNRIARDIMSAAFGGRRESYFRRVGFYYLGPALDGEYWLPGFRLAPAVVEDDMPGMHNVERVVHIDQKVRAVDPDHATGVAKEVAFRHAARLGLLLDLCFYVRPPVRSWCFEQEIGSTTSIQPVRMWSGYVTSAAFPEEMPPKGQMKLGNYDGRIGDGWSGGRLKLPTDARAALRAMDEASHEVQRRLDGCARLHQVSRHVGRLYPSVGLTYAVAAVDALAAGDAEFDGFADLVTRFTPDRSDQADILEFLYRSVRSSNIHGGEFRLGDFSAGTVGLMTEPDEVYVSEYRTRGRLMLRRTVLSWLAANCGWSDA